MIDQSLISSKIAALKNSSNAGGGYVKIPFLKLTEGKIQLRLLPNKYNPNFPFTEKWVYYGFNGETFNSPMSFGDPDPIQEFASSVSDKTLKKTITPSYDIIVATLVRGKEYEGIKYWRFSRKVFEQILSYMSDSDYGDITDLQTGRDIVVEYTPKEKSPTSYAETKIMVKPNQTPAIDNPTELERLMDTQIDILAGERKLSYEQVKEKLENYFSNSEAKAKEEGTDYNNRFNTNTNTTNSTTSEEKTIEYKEKLSSEIDDLFA
jgi:hypothetical protein